MKQVAEIEFSIPEKRGVLFGTRIGGLKKDDNGNSLDIILSGAVIRFNVKRGQHEIVQVDVNLSNLAAEAIKLAEEHNAK